MIKLTSTCTSSLFLNSFFGWTVSTSIAWNLIYRHFYCNFLVNVFTNNTNWLLPSVIIICLGVDSEWSGVFNSNVVNKWFIAVVVQHLTLGNWTFFAILIYEEISCIYLSILWLVQDRIWEVYFSWVFNMVKHADAFSSAFLQPCAAISWAVFG